MEGDIKFPSVFFAKLAVNVPEGANLVQHLPKRNLAQQDNHLRVDELDLPIQPEGTTGGEFHICRSSIFGRAALDGIGDIDLCPLQAVGIQKLAQKFSGSTDKRFAVIVFLAARCFTEEHVFRTKIPFARYGMYPVFVQGTLLALSYRTVHFAHTLFYSFRHVYSFFSSVIPVYWR
jgi:hypothetical protein